MKQCGEEVPQRRLLCVCVCVRNILLSSSPHYLYAAATAAAAKKWNAKKAKKAVRLEEEEGRATQIIKKPGEGRRNPSRQ